MVTEIIQQNDVHTHYMNIHYWIRNGITNDAVHVCRERWEQINKTICNPYLIRNMKINNLTEIQPINKW